MWTPAWIAGYYCFVLLPIIGSQRHRRIETELQRSFLEEYGKGRGLGIKVAQCQVAIICQRPNDMPTCDGLWPTYDNPNSGWIDTQTETKAGEKRSRQHQNKHNERRPWSQNTSPRVLATAWKPHFKTCICNWNWACYKTFVEQVLRVFWASLKLGVPCSAPLFEGSCHILSNCTEIMGHMYRYHGCNPSDRLIICKFVVKLKWCWYMIDDL